MFPEHAIATGRALYPATYARDPATFDDAVGLIVDYIKAERLRKPTFCSYLQKTLNSRCGPAHLLWTARWASCGFPQLTLGHKLAASLCATRLPAEALESVRPPWPAYLVLVPNDLIVVPDALGSSAEAVSVDFLTVFDAGPFVHVTAMSRSSEYMMSTGHRNLAGGLSDDLAEQEGNLGEVERRALALLWRMMVGIDIEMSDPTRFRAPSNARSTKKSAQDLAAMPSAATYQLLRDVVVDCRGAVGNFIDGTLRNGPTVQLLVRGHWKRQVHGAGRVNRRWIHIEPHWRGPEDAPIAIRRHAVGRE